MVPEEQFGFKTADVNSGVQRLLLDSVRSVISLLVSRKVRTNNVTKIHYYLNSTCFSLFHFPVLETRFKRHCYHEVLLGLHIN